MNQGVPARRGVIELSHPVDLALRIGARATLGAAIVIFTIALLLGNLPTDPEGGALTEDVLVPLQIGLLLCTGAGLAFSFRWMAIAAATVAVAGTGVAVISALQYEAPVPTLVGVAFLLPAVMMWLDWQCRETLGKIVVLAVGTSVLLLVAWLGSSRVYAHFFGPTHPDSDAAAVFDPVVEWAWSGAVSSSGFSVVAMVREPVAELALVVTNGADEIVHRSEPIVVDDVGAPARFEVDSLVPGTDYRYAFESSDTPTGAFVGAVATFPDGASSLTLAFGSCARTDSNGAVFDAILDRDPDLYVIAGDLHYRNIDVDDTALFASAYDEVHESPGQSRLYRSVPIAYVWDDHDFGPNDSDASSPSRPAASESYRSFVPHYELEQPEDGAIHQAFTVGRVRVVMIDTRSHRSAADGALLGGEQVDWLLDELLDARDTHALTILVSPTAWIGPDVPGADHWGGYAAERDQIIGFVDEHSIDNVVLIGGDAHMVALDDGTNSGFGGDDGFPVLQVAALDRRGSIKGGPHSHGQYPGGGQFGVIEVNDDGGDRIEVELLGLDWEGATLTSLTTEIEVP